jgi:hypothetical protein
VSHAAVTLTECPNCGRALDGAYCAECGQKVAPVNPSLHDFAHDFIHELLHVDGKIFRSVQLLLTRPGYLTREYFEGRRVRYVSPIRLYLIFSLVYFAVAAVAPQAERGGIRVTASGVDDAELRKRGFESEEQLQRAASAAVNTWAPRAMFALVPLFALLAKAVTRGSRRNYPQHLYFALHLHAAAFAFLTVGVLARYARPLPYVKETVGIAAMVWLVTYAVLAFRRAYGGTTVRAVLRTAVVGVGYFLALIAAIGAIVAPVIRRLIS